ncbi:hypothetical protein J2T17_007132 [Paenibacillus mucilaginosus]|uniref:hypothetical protein n=1 Tax=Paenibacillus mucilaginosus TaxID=61624 RepID=UPI003D22E2F9
MVKAKPRIPLYKMTATLPADGEPVLAVTVHPSVERKNGFRPDRSQTLLLSRDFNRLGSYVRGNVKHFSMWLLEMPDEEEALLAFHELVTAHIEGLFAKQEEQLQELQKELLGNRHRLEQLRSLSVMTDKVV